MHLLPLHDCTPLRAARALSDRARLVWLDGTRGATPEGRFSFLSCDPVEVRRVPFGASEPLANLSSLGPAPGGGDLDASLGGIPIPWWIGYVAYDAAWSGQTRTPRRLPRSPDAPVVWLGRYPTLALWDHERDRAWVVGEDAAAASALRDALLEPAPGGTAKVSGITAEDAAGHGAAIERALEHIAAGDIYQVNLARRWSGAFEGSPLALWEHMRDASPVPLGFFLQAGDHAVLARTMERFLSWAGPGGALASRPIKGTIARAGADVREAAQLASDTKERAEHAMIVDLMRNDLGRLAAIGSVEVRDGLTVEPYAKLAHLVSTVRCVTRADVSLRDVFEATFPPGSVTGAPKIRAVEIIEALERSARDIYTGAVGFVDRRGGASFAVAIRTAVVRAGRVAYHAGGGLVSASRIDREVAETELKARVFLDAVEALGAG